MQHFRAVWMISLCHMLIQKKIIIIRSVTEILHINVIQCQLILMKHLSSFLRMTILIYSILNLGIAFLALYGFTGIRYDWSVDILLCKPGHDGPTLARSDSPYWSHARKVTNFVTFGQCLHIHRKKNKRPSWVYCAANTVGFHYRLSKWTGHSWFLSKRNLLLYNESFND